MSANISAPFTIFFLLYFCDPDRNFMLMILNDDLIFSIPEIDNLINGTNKYIIVT